MGVTEIIAGKLVFLTRGDGVTHQVLPSLGTEEVVREGYLTKLREEWPEDQPPIVRVEDIGGRIGLVGITDGGIPVVTSCQLGVLREYETAMRLQKMQAQRVGGYYVLIDKNGVRRGV